MNVFVADPEWGWWIILYFYFGGIAAGAYFLATLVDLAGGDEDRPLSRLGYRLAFPLVALCGIFLVVDLERPERFWHMLLQSERVDDALAAGWPGGGWGDMLQAIMFKPWSPMSIGAWALLLFGGFSFLSFLASFRQQGWLARRLRSRVFGRVFHLLGCAVGFFIASYTGVLLHATNEPVWSVTDWIGPLFLVSAASTGIAAVLLLARWSRSVGHDSVERLERADLWALGLELAVFVVFLASLGAALELVCETWQGLVLVLATPVLALLLPLVLHMFPALVGRRPAATAAACALLGGFLLRWAIVVTPSAVLARYPPDLAATVYRDKLANLAQATLWDTLAGKVLVGVALLLAVLGPLAFRLRLGVPRWLTALAGVFSVGVIAAVLYYGTAAPATGVGQPPALVRVSPEDGRERGGGVGASALNRPKTMHPRSKIPEMSRP
jgi:formate-dependent nitrite reductase membrane component NrfD